MTDQENALRELLAKGTDASVLREVEPQRGSAGFAAERLMELEVGALTGGAHGKRSPDRLAQRNGYRDRDWETRAGTVELVDPRCGSTPKLRRGSYVPGVRCHPARRRHPARPKRRVWTAPALQGVSD